jgi:hypothetical protein
MKTLIIDSQILNAYQECPCKCYYTFEKNIRPAIKEPAFDKGGLLHDMLESHYTSLRDHYKVSPTLPREIYNDFVQKAILLGQSSAAQRDLDTEDCLRVISAYEQYADYRFGESWVPLFVEEVGTKLLWQGFIENYEETNREELQIMYAFKIDLVAKVDWNAEKPSIIDHKSEERSSDPIEMDNQFLGYAWGLDLRNVIINKVGFQKSLKAEDKFRRYTLHFPESIIQEWHHNTIKWAIRIYHSLQDLEEMKVDRNIHSCKGKYGKPCGLIQICNTEPQARDWKINSAYLIGEKWDVTRRLAKERN